MIGLGGYEYLKLAVYYTSYLYFPAVILLTFLILKSRGWRSILAMFILIGLTVLAYARFVEPRILLVKNHSLAFTRCFDEAGSVRLAIFSDTHNGLFGNAISIERIVARLNTIDADIALIAGDFIYFLHPDRMEETYAAFSNADLPVVGVLGNHDVGYPGPDVDEPLIKTLTDIGVRVIDNEPIYLNRAGKRVEIIGLSDLWQNQQDISLLSEEAPYPRIVLTHNPATVQHIPVRSPVDLLVAGHTHGGQIYIPFVTCKLLSFACRISRYGLSAQKRAVTFVTSGTGMVGLPMRFNMPPRIDVLNVRYNQCLPR